MEEKPREAKQPVEPETSSQVQSDDHLEGTEKDQRASEIQEKDTPDIPETKEESNENEEQKEEEVVEEKEKEEEEEEKNHLFKNSFAQKFIKTGGVGESDN